MTAVAKINVLSVCLESGLNVFSNLGITCKTYMYFRIDYSNKRRCLHPGAVVWLVCLYPYIFGNDRPGLGVPNLFIIQSCADVSRYQWLWLFFICTIPICNTDMSCLMCNIRICRAFVIQSQYLMHRIVTLISPGELMTQHIDINHSVL